MIVCTATSVKHRLYASHAPSHYPSDVNAWGLQTISWAASTFYIVCRCDYALTTSYRGSILQDNMIFTNNLPGIESTKPGPCGKQDLPSPTVPLLDLQPLNSRNQLFSKGKEQISPTSSAQKLFPSLQPSTACSELWLPTCSFHDTSYESRRQVAAVSNSLLVDISNLKRELEFGCASKKNQEQICMQTLDASLAWLVQLTGKSRVPLPM